MPGDDIFVPVSLERVRGERLQKVLAAAGLGSRRACEQIIADGRVSVNGKVVTVQGTRVDPAADAVEVDGIRLDTQVEPRYFLLHKPPGYLTTMEDPHGRPTVLDIFKENGRFFPVGRLDMESRGLLLITNNGFVAHRLTHPRFRIDKTYVARVSGQVSPGVLRQLREGVELEEGRTSPARVRVVGREGDSTVLEFVIHQGWKRQIRRMCEAVGLRVTDLMRTRLGPLTIAGLPEGRWRELRPSEVDALLNVLRLQ
ncbi:MAG: pseudouridine synthase [Dehalococcoidia bacterium]|nr:pseudouridine synthase [Dehalococcoidia bacterium]